MWTMWAMGSGEGSPLRSTTLRPIAPPGSPQWLRWAFSSGWRGAVFRSTAIVIVLLTLTLPLAMGVAGYRSPAVLLGSCLAGGIAMAGARMRRVVRGPSWSVGGVPIEGEAFSLLEDIDHRFAYAERLVDEVPTGIHWEDVRDDVDALLWDAAVQAAELSKVDRDLVDLRYAANGTPQAAYRAELMQQREDHLASMKATQWEAELLARVAGNALAAAKLALTRTGSVRSLEVAAPSPRVVLARWNLSEVRARLQMLADVWSELDDTTAIAAERLSVEGGEEQAR